MKVRRPVTLAITLVVALVAVIGLATRPWRALGTDPSTADPDAGQWVVAYYVGYQMDLYPIERIDWSTFTHLAFGAVLVNPDQTLNTSFYGSPESGEANARRLAEAAHANHRSALLMFGGAGTGADIARAATPANRAALVDRLVDTADRLGFDGYDLDWEDGYATRPDGAPDYTDLVALARDLRAARPGMILTSPVVPINPNVEPAVDPDLVALAGTVDKLGVMTYAPATAIVGSGWASWFSSPLQGAGARTPVSIEDSLGRYAAAGIPKSKLLLGIGFYAICYPAGITGPRQPTRDGDLGGGDNAFPAGDVFAAGGLWERAGTDGRRYDPAAENPYLTFPSPVTDPHCGSEPTQYIGYEDERSLLAKGVWSRANGYGGAIVWTIQEGILPASTADARPADHLLRALKQAFLA